MELAGFRKAEGGLNVTIVQMTNESSKQMRGLACPSKGTRTHCRRGRDVERLTGSHFAPVPERVIGREHISP